MPGLPSPDGNTIARRLFKAGDIFTVSTTFLVPVAQWGAISIHVDTGLGGDFTLRARWTDLLGITYEEAGADPAIDGTVHLDNTRVRYVITAAEHQAEAFLQVIAQVPTAQVNVNNFDIMGTPN
jgi:hypothetical protein